MAVSNESMETKAAAILITLDMDIIASGGVSSMDDVKALAAMGIHGAIIGKAYYTGAIDLAEAVREAGAAGQK